MFVPMRGAFELKGWLFVVMVAAATIEALPNRPQHYIGYTSPYGSLQQPRSYIDRFGFVPTADSNKKFNSQMRQEFPEMSFTVMPKIHVPLYNVKYPRMRLGKIFNKKYELYPSALTQGSVRKYKKQYGDDQMSIMPLPGNRADDYQSDKDNFQNGFNIPQTTGYNAALPKSFVSLTRGPNGYNPKNKMLVLGRKGRTPYPNTNNNYKIKYKFNIPQTIEYNAALPKSFASLTRGPNGYNPKSKMLVLERKGRTPYPNTNNYKIKYKFNIPQTTGYNGALPKSFVSLTRGPNGYNPKSKMLVLGRKGRTPYPNTNNNYKIKYKFNIPQTIEYNAALPKSFVSLTRGPNGYNPKSKMILLGRKGRTPYPNTNNYQTKNDFDIPQATGYNAAVPKSLAALPRGPNDNNPMSNTIFPGDKSIYRYPNTNSIYQTKNDFNIPQATGYNAAVPKSLAELPRGPNDNNPMSNTIFPGGKSIYRYPNTNNYQTKNINIPQGTGSNAALLKSLAALPRGPNDNNPMSNTIFPGDKSIYRYPNTNNNYQTKNDFNIPQATGYNAAVPKSLTALPRGPNDNNPMSNTIFPGGKSISTYPNTNNNYQTKNDFNIPQATGYNAAVPKSLAELPRGPNDNNPMSNTIFPGGKSIYRYPNTNNYQTKNNINIPQGTGSNAALLKSLAALPRSPNDNNPMSNTIFPGGKSIYPYPNTNNNYQTKNKFNIPQGTGNNAALLKSLAELPRGPNDNNPMSNTIFPGGKSISTYPNTNNNYQTKNNINIPQGTGSNAALLKSLAELPRSPNDNNPMSNTIFPGGKSIYPYPNTNNNYQTKNNINIPQGTGSNAALLKFLVDSKGSSPYPNTNNNNQTKNKFNIPQGTGNNAALLKFLVDSKGSSPYPNTNNNNQIENKFNIPQGTGNNAALLKFLVDSKGSSPYPNTNNNNQTKNKFNIPQGTGNNAALLKFLVDSKGSSPYPNTNNNNQIENKFNIPQGTGNNAALLKFLVDSKGSPPYPNTNNNYQTENKFNIPQGTGNNAALLKFLVDSKGSSPYPNTNNNNQIENKFNIPQGTGNNAALLKFLVDSKGSPPYPNTNNNYQTENKFNIPQGTGNNAALLKFLVDSKGSPPYPNTNNNYQTENKFNIPQGTGNNAALFKFLVDSKGSSPYPNTNNNYQTKNKFNIPQGAGNNPALLKFLVDSKGSPPYPNTNNNYQTKNKMNIPQGTGNNAALLKFFAALPRGPNDNNPMRNMNLFGSNDNLPISIGSNYFTFNNSKKGIAKGKLAAIYKPASLALENIKKIIRLLGNQGNAVDINKKESTCTKNINETPATETRTTVSKPVTLKSSDRNGNNTMVLSRNTPDTNKINNISTSTNINANPAKETRNRKGNENNTTKPVVFSRNKDNTPYTNKVDIKLQANGNYSVDPKPASGLIVEKTFRIEIKKTTNPRTSRKIKKTTPKENDPAVPKTDVSENRVPSSRKPTINRVLFRKTVKVKKSRATAKPPQSVSASAHQIIVKTHLAGNKGNTTYSEIRINKTTSPATEKQSAVTKPMASVNGNGTIKTMIYWSNKTITPGTNKNKYNNKVILPANGSHSVPSKSDTGNGFWKLVTVLDKKLNPKTRKNEARVTQSYSPIDSGNRDQNLNGTMKTMVVSSSYGNIPDINQKSNFINVVEIKKSSGNSSVPPNPLGAQRKAKQISSISKVIRKATVTRSYSSVSPPVVPGSRGQTDLVSTETTVLVGGKGINYNANGKINKAEGLGQNAAMSKSVAPVSVSGNNKYYWKVVRSTDDVSNSSDVSSNIDMAEFSKKYSSISPPTESKWWKDFQIIGNNANNKMKDSKGSFSTVISKDQTSGFADGNEFGAAYTNIGTDMDQDNWDDHTITESSSYVNDNGKVFESSVTEQKSVTTFPQTTLTKGS